MLSKLSIRGVLIALGGVGIFATCSLAGLGLFVATLQLHARESVAIVEKAILNHGIADASLDDVRGDIQRGLLVAVGLSRQNETSLRLEVSAHVSDLRERISQNEGLALPLQLHQHYADLDARLDAFAAGVEEARKSSVDPATQAEAFDAFRLAFADVDALMDLSRDELNVHAAQVRDAAAVVFNLVRWIIIGAMLIGVSSLMLITWGAIRLGSSITGALASSRQEAEYQALHDALTGLPNRLFMIERLRDALAEVERNENLLALLCLDLDRFKQVNDTLGHPVGDELLRAVADRLRSCMRKSDMIARLGGDEFVIIQTPIARAEEAGKLSQRIIDLLSEPYEVAGHHVVISASIGLALAPGDSVDPHTLLKMADMALYRAKADGRKVFRSFETGMDAKLQARRLLELDLRRAVRGGEFELHYQPLMNLVSSRVTSVEALVRWRHPERGLIPPIHFIPLAEEIGLIDELGGWVLRQACQDAAQWPSDVLIAVNVAPAQFRNGSLVQAVEEALALSALPPQRLELEITETALLDSTETVLSILNELRSRGVRIAMDDFGTGYSSLGYLLSFPFDKIKIDACFIRNLHDRPDSRAIVRAVIGLAHELGITTVAEGVETEEQLARLMHKGCEQIQGYILSRPVPAQQLAQFLEPAHTCKAHQPGTVRISTPSLLTSP